MVFGYLETADYDSPNDGVMDGGCSLIAVYSFSYT